MIPDPELLVIVPSRGRPTTVTALADAFAETCGADTRLVFAVDEDDPELPAYGEAIALAKQPVELWINHGAKTMVAALNGAVAALLSGDPSVMVAFMGDDHRPRTPGWDSRYLAAMEDLGTGIVYGNDLLQGENIPTQVAMTADIPLALGHMAPPTLTHLFVDNYWKDLGKGADCIRYLPDVVIEHLHPFAHKAAMDDGYRRVNEPAMYRRDSDAYAVYAFGTAAGLANDIAKVKALR